MATISPAAVLISASLMPWASCVGVGLAVSLKTKNERTIPITVPSRPSSGAIWAAVPSALRPA